MRYGEIIQKAWKLTWRFRYLWVLAIFAGITGPSGGGGGNFNSSSGFPGDSGGSGSSDNPFDPGFFYPQIIEQWLPIIILAVSIWIIVTLVFVVLGVAARGGLIFAVDEIESGRVPTLGQTWSVGFSRFWSLFGLSVLLVLPVVVLLVLLMAAVFVPLAMVGANGGEGWAAAIAPMCGVLVIGVPLLIVLSIVLGFMRVIAERSIMLEGARVFDAAGGAWRTFRARIKDSLLMWLISWGLSAAAGIVLAIPIVILTFALLMPAIVFGVSGNLGPAIGVGVVWLLVILALAIVFTGIWGTYTSALWTIFYRRLVGREVLPPTVTPNMGPTPGYVPPGPQPYVPQAYAPQPYAPPGMQVPPVGQGTPQEPFAAPPVDQGPPMAAPPSAQPSSGWAAPEPPPPPAPPSEESQPPHV